MVGVAQLVRAPDCGSGCRGFESHLPPHLKIKQSGALRPPLPFRHLLIGVSPSGKARDFDSLIRWFESSHPCHDLPKLLSKLTIIYAPVAQSAEHLPFKQGVRSSNLRWSTKNSLSSDRLFFCAPGKCTPLCQNNISSRLPLAKRLLISFFRGISTFSPPVQVFLSDNYFSPTGSSQICPCTVYFFMI